jgi:ABC-type sugar transport system ATPase subunit
MTLADRVAVFMEGRIVQVGPPREIFGRPAHVSVAGFIGTPAMNLLPATWDGMAVRVGPGPDLPVASAHAGPREVTLGVRPADLRLATSGLPARVELVEELGDGRIVNLSLDSGGARTSVKIKCDNSAPLAEGQDVCLDFAPASAHLFDRASGLRLA